MVDHVIRHVVVGPVLLMLCPQEEGRPRVERAPAWDRERRRYSALAVRTRPGRAVVIGRRA